MKHFTSLAGMSFLCIILSCNHADNTVAEKNQNDIHALKHQQKALAEEKFYTDTVPHTGQATSVAKTSAPNVDWDKKIIKIGTLNLEVKDYKAFNTSLRDKIRSVGGYVAQEEQVQSDYKIENAITLKVPVDQFDVAVALLTGNGEKIIEKKIASQDVTTEMVDTRSRMESKRQVRLRYLDLLKQAKNMEEILTVEGQMNSVQAEIESAAGRINYLSHSAAYSTINLVYYQVLNSRANENEQPSFGEKLFTGFRLGWSWIGSLLVGLVTVWPLFLAAFITFILYKKIRRKGIVSN